MIYPYPSVAIHLSSKKKTVCAAIFTLSAGIAQAQTSSPEPVTLAPVVISAGGFEQFIRDAPASISVITREQLEDQQITNLADALRGLEGVNTSPLDARDGKAGHQSISLRGLPREYTLILIDGVRQNPLANVTPNSFNDTQSVFIPPVAAIERIEVIRGPMSTLYGSDALGGVVNIITRKAGNTWKGTASIGHTFQSGREFGDKTLTEVYLNGPLSEVASLQLYGKIYDRQSSSVTIPGVVQARPITTDTPTMGQNPVAAETLTLGGRLTLKPAGPHELSLSFNTTRQQYDNSQGDIGALSRTGSPALSACNSTPAPNFCRGYEQDLRFNRDQFTLGHSMRQADGRWDTKFTQDKLETAGRTIPLNSGLSPALEGSPRNLELTTRILDSRYFTAVGKQHVVTLGGQLLDLTFTDGIFGGGVVDGRQYSVFLEDEWSLTNKLTLTSGLRYDKNRAYSGEFTPRLYGVYKIVPTITLKGGVGAGFRTPLAEQLTRGIIGFGNQGSTPILGNSALQPEKSINIEASVFYQPNKNLSTQATVFRHRLQDLIEPGTGANSGQSLNVGEALVQGLEWSSSWQIGRQWSMDANYTFIDSQVTKTQLDTGSPAQNIASRTGDPLVSVPDHMANLKLHWKPTGQWSSFIALDYRSSAFRPRNFHEPQNGGNAQGRVFSGVRDSNEVLGNFAGYTTLNLGVAYQLTASTTIRGVINNVLDKSFKNYKAYNACGNAGCTSTIQALSNGYNNVLEPRRLFVSLNIDF